MLISVFRRNTVVEGKPHKQEKHYFQYKEQKFAHKLDMIQREHVYKRPYNVRYNVMINGTDVESLQVIRILSTIILILSI